VLVNFARKISALPQNAGSAYVELVEDAYTIGFVVAGSTTSLLTLTGIPLNAAHTYTLYLVGTAAQLTSIVTRDD